MAKSKNCFSGTESFSAWLKGPTCAIYTNYFLSAWGDWMWLFSCGLYLVYLANGSLRLAAILGFSGGSLMLLCGGIIGDWVDRNGRMKVVSISLFIQNLSVALCATSVCLTLVYKDMIYGDLLHAIVRPLVESIIITLALVAFLASMAYKIAIEKDWIVVVAAGNTASLTNLNAVTRAIDLSCKILAPTVAGLVMSYSHIIAAIFIAAWNVVSVFCEFALLRRVYRLVPELAIKGQEKTDVKEYEMEDIKAAAHTEVEPITSVDQDDGENRPSPECEPLDGNGNADEQKISNGVNGTLKTSRENFTSDAKKDEKNKNKCLRKVAEPFITIGKGWTTYMNQRVVYAGLSLAFLYMTVLGFDYVTTGYIYANGVDETYVGISMAAAGITGILGTFAFSFLNKRLGLERTGLIAFISEVLCLILTVASIWAPGSVFDPTFSKPASNCSAITNRTTAPNITLTQRLENSSSLFGISIPNLLDNDSVVFSYPFGSPVDQPANGFLPTLLTRRRRDLLALEESAALGAETLLNELPDTCEKNVVTVSIILFMIGIVTSRVGLWMADLVVTQLLQENVPEMERGIVHGVQNSLNMLMDMIKNALVIVLPSVETFGILIILSFLFICSGTGFFLGHIVKFDKSVFACKKFDRPPPVIDEMDVNSRDPEFGFIDKSENHKDKESRDPQVI